MQDSIPSAVAEPGRIPKARYAYYRRCQVFRKGGEQCKARAEKDALICHAHAGQLAMAVRRERERRAVLEEAVEEMRRRGNAEYEMKDLFMDFKGIQVMLAKSAQALINGRIDCKTAGRLVVGLQMASKLLWVYHRGHRGALREKTLTTKDTKEHKGLPQICADERQLVEGKEPPALFVVRPISAEMTAEKHRAANQREETRMRLMADVLAFTHIRGSDHGPPEWARAA
jgi:hypothetical protein